MIYQEYVGYTLKISRSSSVVGEVVVVPNEFLTGATVVVWGLSMGLIGMIVESRIMPDAGILFSQCQIFFLLV